MTCPVCSDPSYEVVWQHASGIANGLCLSCGHVYVTGVETLDAHVAYADFAQSYPDEYLLDPSMPLFDYARSRAQSLRHWKPDLGAVLEIGSGYGHFLHVLGEGRFRAGLEPSPAGVTFARTRFGLEMVVQGSLETVLQGSSGTHFRDACETASQGPSETATPSPVDHVGADWPGQKVDAVCAFHVLEHLRDPFTLLEFARTRLTENGLLVIAVPDLRTLNPDLIELYFLRRGWHLHTFQEDSIRRLLAGAGFDLIHVESERRSTMYPSSLLIISRFTVEQNRVFANPAVAASRAALYRFHAKLNHGLNALREELRRWQARGMRIAIYGGGMHTRALLDLAEIAASSIACVIDDDPAKAGNSIAGVPCLSLAQVMRTPPDVILVSTLASEESLLASLPQKLGSDIQIFGIYRDFLA